MDDLKEKGFGVAILGEGTERSSDERSEAERSRGSSSKITGSRSGGMARPTAGPTDPSPSCSARSSGPTSTCT